MDAENVEYFRPPFKYYGGKLWHLKHIIPHIPSHKCYAEPFAGGAAVFFGKKPAITNHLNDKNKHLITFYQVVKRDFKLFYDIVQTIPNSEAFYKRYMEYLHKDTGSEMDRAVAVYLCFTQGYLNHIPSYWRISTKITSMYEVWKPQLNDKFLEKLDMCHIHCSEALKFIDRVDRNYTFFYVDPPYIGRGQGHYKGYKEAEFERLLVKLGTIKGRFMLSCNHSDLLTEYVRKHGWNQHEYWYSPKNRQDRVSEVLTKNYSIEEVSPIFNKNQNALVCKGR